MDWVVMVVGGRGMVGCAQWHHAGFREGQHGIDKYLPLVTGYSRQTAARRIEDIIENRECRLGRV